jgi:hypothetical protein
MRLADLQQALTKVNSAAVLVTPQVLEKVIQQVCNFSGLPWEIPHRKSYVVDRQTLFRHIEQEDLDLGGGARPDNLLPPTVILLVRPTNEQLALENNEVLLGVYWRRLFHASVHLLLEQRWDEGLLTREEIRGRIEEIGRTQFEEIRKVLIEDRFLLHQADEHTAYIEFAAMYLELRFFAANLLPIYFPSLATDTGGATLAPQYPPPVAPSSGRPPESPSLGQREAVDRILARDFDPAQLFAATRLKGAVDPEVILDNSSDESHDYYHKLIRQAERAARQGNLVRSAILRTRAARVAPANLTRSTRAEAEGDMHQLAGRLAAALELNRGESAEWARDLNSLLDKADQGTRPVEADLLFDLQKVCLDAEQGVFALSLIDYLVSLGRRPIKRALPCQRQVRILKHLRDAAERLTMARLSDADRLHLSALIETTLQQGEERLRIRFRPILEVALQDVGLEPSNPPERVAFYKIIEELLDRIIAGGYLTFSDLRDVISRNQLKLPDLNDPQEFMHGDPLLRLDRRLASLLDGVYRPSEIYSRMLERLTAISFGTRLGRLLSVWLLIPFGGAFIIMEGCKIVAEEFLGKPLLRGDLVNDRQQAAPLAPLLSPVMDTTLLLTLGFFLLGLWHSPRFRAATSAFLLDSLRLFRFLIVGFPLEVARWSLLRRIGSSWAFQFLSWFVLKPGALFLTVWLLSPELMHNQVLAGLVFLLFLVVVNSNPGQAIGQVLGHGLAYISRTVSVSLFKGLFTLIATVFKQVLTVVEDVLFAVDEWMRFRTGESEIWIGIRLVLGVLWFPISFLARFYMVVLIEPGINPLKYPVSMIAGKLMLPLAPLIYWLVDSLAPTLGHVMAWVLVVPTLTLLPDAFGYLFWELKENWGLYRANRPSNVGAASIGPHGETLLTLLEPGFHSGTIPRLFARWRRAEREAIRTRNWRLARSYRHALEELQETLKLFVTRNLVNLLRESRAWKESPPAVGRVFLSRSQIRIELTHVRSPGNSVWLDFQDRHGWLTASISSLGWLAELEPREQEPMNAGLLFLYKLAGVRLVHEQLRSQLPVTVREYDITADYLVTWQDRYQSPPVRYDWRAYRGQLLSFPPGSPSLDASRCVFSNAPLAWDRLVQWWQNESAGQENPETILQGVAIDLIALARPESPMAARVSEPLHIPVLAPSTLAASSPQTLVNGAHADPGSVATE